MGKPRRRIRAVTTFISLVFSLALAFFCSNTVHAVIIGSFSWSGTILGERPDYETSGTALFEVSGTTLTITLTNNAPDLTLAIGEVLSGLTWDITDSGVSLTPVSAVIAPGSHLAGTGATSAMDISGEWFFKDDLSAGSTFVGPIGSFGLGTMGDVNFGADTFGKHDAFKYQDDGHGQNIYNLFGPSGPNGIEVGIVNQFVDFTADGFGTQGPLVQGIGPSPGQMIFTFNFSGDLGAGEIVNVQPLFGTDGAPLPEPGMVLLLGFAMGGIYLYHRLKP